MEVLLDKDCTFDEMTYPAGSEICSLLRCMICQEGRWEVRESYGLADLVGQPFCRGIRLI